MTARNLFAGAALAALLFAAEARAAGPVPGASAPTANTPRDVSLDGYREHLQQLIPIVDACAKARDTKTCDPTLVGLDDRVPLGPGSNAERRLVRYGWLRLLLAQAQDKDTSPEKPAADSGKGAKNTLAKEGVEPPKPTTTQLLQDAETRLDRDIAQATALSAAAPSLPDHSQERETMRQVLAGREFRNLEATPARDAFWEWLNKCLNWLLARLAVFSIRAAWAGRAIVWGFILAVCAGLVWLLLQLERKGRIRLTPEDGPAAGAASARDWQLWLEDAHKAAAAGLWREAIHFVYWASISRLESRRLWPADRARTPREYVALVAPEDPRKAGLTMLTRTFERIWYGGRPAGQRDYLEAEELANGLISKSGATVIGAASQAAIAEGAAQ